MPERPGRSAGTTKSRGLKGLKLEVGFGGPLTSSYIYFKLMISSLIFSSFPNRCFANIQRHLMAAICVTFFSSSSKVGVLKFNITRFYQLLILKMKVERLVGRFSIQDLQIT